MLVIYEDYENGDLWYAYVYLYFSALCLTKCACNLTQNPRNPIQLRSNFKQMQNRSVLMLLEREA